MFRFLLLLHNSKINHMNKIVSQSILTVVHVVYNAIMQIAYYGPACIAYPRESRYFIVDQCCYMVLQHPGIFCNDMGGSSIKFISL